MLYLDKKQSGLLWSNLIWKWLSFAKHSESSVWPFEFGSNPLSLLIIPSHYWNLLLECNQRFWGLAHARFKQVKCLHSRYWHCNHTLSLSIPFRVQPIGKLTVNTLHMESFSLQCFEKHTAYVWQHNMMGCLDCSNMFEIVLI